MNWDSLFMGKEMSGQVRAAYCEPPIMLRKVWSLQLTSHQEVSKEWLCIKVWLLVLLT